MIKVAFLKSRALFRGGLEKYTLHLIKAFVEKGCSVTLLTTGDPPSIAGAHSISLSPHSKFTFYHLYHFNAVCQKWLRSHPQDIVFGMERTTFQTHYRAGNGVHAVYLKRRATMESIWKRVSFLVNPLHRQILAMEKKAFEDANLRVLFTNSYMVRDEILIHYTIDPTKIEVVHNGVEWNKWSQAFDQTFQKKREGPFELLFIGNGYKRKGLLFLLQALEKHSNKSFHLTVVGRDKDPSFFSHWVEKKGLKKKVSFAGCQENVLPFYQAADVLVIPSVYDPFANVTVEALAMGLHVVSSPFNGGKEVLNHFSGSVIEDLNSVDSFASTLEQAFTHPKTEESAINIRQSIKELDFSLQLDKIVQKTLKTI